MSVGPHHTLPMTVIEHVNTFMYYTCFMQLLGCERPLGQFFLYS